MKKIAIVIKSKGQYPKEPSTFDMRIKMYVYPSNRFLSLALFIYVPGRVDVAGWPYSKICIGKVDSSSLE